MVQIKSFHSKRDVQHIYTNVSQHKITSDKKAIQFDTHEEHTCIFGVGLRTLRTKCAYQKVTHACRVISYMMEREGSWGKKINSIKSIICN